MKSLRSLSVLLASGGLAVAVSLAAQGGGSGTPAHGAGAGANPNPASNRPAAPNTPPYNPQVSAPPSSPTAPIDRTTAPGAAGNGMTPGAANSGSGAGGRETMTPNAPVTQNTNDLPKAKGAATAGAPGTGHFKTLDVDGDGRISPAEFTAPSAAWLRNGPSATGVANSGGVAGGHPAATTPGRPATPGSHGVASDATSAASNAELFKQVDTNRDGYLSQAEVDAYRPPTSLKP